MSVAVTTQQLADAAIEATNRRYRCIGVLHRVDICFPVTVKVPCYQSLNRRDLRQSWQRLESISAVYLAEKDTAAKFRCGESLCSRQFVVTQDLIQSGMGIRIVSWKAPQNRWNGRAEIPAGAPWIKLIAFVISLN